MGLFNKLDQSELFCGITISTTKLKPPLDRTIGPRSYEGGRAQRVAVLSADVEMKENSVGCHRMVMALSLCSATTTEDSSWARSPCRSVSRMELS